MSITPSHLRHALKRISKASCHPNALAYKIQLQDATKKYLVRETENGGIALPPPSSSTMLEGEGAIEEPSMMKELACEGKNAKDSKKVVEKPSEEAGNGRFGDVTCRRFMSLAVLDTTSIIRFLSEGTKSAKH
jgi:hypothetical protein